MIKNPFKSIIREYCVLLLGCFLMALSINIFLVPNKIAPGGVTGIAEVLFHLSNGKLPVGTTMFFLNVPLFILGYKQIGRGFILKTFFGSIILSVFIDLTEPRLKYFVEHYFRQNPDLFLYSVAGGFLLGTGLGLVFRIGASTGGTDLASGILHSILPRISLGQFMLLVDGIVVIFAAISFKSFKLGLYAVVSIYISSKITDTMLEGINFAKGMFIISDKWEIISNEILLKVKRGVTSFYGKGLYSKKDKKILLCIVKPKEIPKVKALVNNIDPEAFVFLTNIHEVLGEGF